ncbi:putative triacylglycerol lipase [Arabidopsis thaliana]
MSIKLLVLVFSLLIIFTRPKLIADHHLTTRISPIYPSISPFQPSIPPFLPPSPSRRAQSPTVKPSLPFVPALFVFGDSSVDSGTNNFLGTLARADRLPYGRDFDTHQPTGRFCNGRIPVDYLGLPFVPSYLGQTGTVEDMFQGVNYASAGAGIILSSGSELGQRVSFAMQVEQFVDTFQQMILSIGEKASERLVSNSVFYISIGVNDYIHFYIRNISNVQNLYTPWNFNQFLASNMRQELKTLYNVKVRRMVVMGLPPIGCAPYYMWKYRSQNGECAEEVNSMIMESNFVMRYTVDKLNRELPGASIIYCDVFQSAMDILRNHQHYGFNETTDACCGLGRYKGWLPCISPEMACSDASGHLWWDQFHPTDAVNAILADNVWNGRHVDMCYPTNLETMLHS